MVPTDRSVIEEKLNELISNHPPAETSPEDFWGAQFDLGLAWPSFPKGSGGMGVSPSEAATANQFLAKAGAPSGNVARNLIGYGMGAPTVAVHGTSGQKQRWLRKLFTAEEIWCQLFSEPGAGSDAAGIGTSAVRDGDEWVVNGQKVWTTLGHNAKWGMLTARTNPGVPKHRGMTYFIIDMDQPGVEVRPLRQITGEAEFNEVYLTDARVPDGDRLGEVGEGWRVSITTLMNERVSIGESISPRGEGAIATAVEVWRNSDSDDPGRRDELMKLWVEAEVIRLTSLRDRMARLQGTPGPEGSTLKLQWAEFRKQTFAWAVNMMGARGMLYPEAYEFRTPDSLETDHSPQWEFLRSRANSIEGGTSEILRNVIGERVLGLPREPRVDLELAWKDVARS
jgi:alkylation response protein AidB-like acyl-CoA dehydrogenase